MPPRSHPDSLLVLWPCGSFSICSSLTLLYFLSSIIISLIPLNIALRNPKLLSYSLEWGLQHWDTLQTPRFPSPRPTHPLETVCILLLDLVVTITKFFWYSSLLKIHSSEPILFMTASESFSLMIIHDIFSLLISTFLLFSRVGKPFLWQTAWWIRW